MKTLVIAAMLALTTLAHPAQAKDLSRLWTTIAETAPRSVFDQIRESAPRSVFDDIRDSAP